MSKSQLARQFNSFLIEVAEDFGSSGADWIKGFKSAPAVTVRSGSDQVVNFAWQGELDEARRVLETMTDSLDTLATSQAPSVSNTCARWHYGASALVDYTAGDFEAALKGLDDAEAAVVQSAELEDFLILLAPCGYEFALHRARIARNRDRRSTMERQLEMAQEMVENYRPFCSLPSGRDIFCSDIYNFLSGLTLSPKQHSILVGLVRDISLPNYELMASRIRQAKPVSAAVVAASE